MKRIAIAVSIVTISLLLGCGHKEESKFLPGADVVRNGEYTLLVKKSGNDTDVAVMRGDRLLWYMTAYDTGLVDQAICISTNRDVFFKDDYRHVGHGSLAYEILNTNGVIEVLRDLNEDGIWDTKEVREKPKSKWYENVGGEWHLKLLDTNVSSRQSARRGLTE